MNRLLALVLAFAGMAVSPFAAAGGPFPPSCSATAVPASLPSSGGNSDVQLNCPSGSASGIHVSLRRSDTGTTTYGAVFSASGAVGPITGLVQTVSMPPNPAPTPVAYNWYWRVCDFTQVACANTAYAVVTVAGSTGPANCSAMASQTQLPSQGGFVTLTITCQTAPAGLVGRVNCGPPNPSAPNCTLPATGATSAAGVLEFPPTSGPSPGSAILRPQACDATGPNPACITLPDIQITVAAQSGPSCTVSPSNAAPQVGDSIMLTATCSNNPSS